jgi:uncharacterized membrane protein YphA (DoxX/SURF4 family)
MSNAEPKPALLWAGRTLSAVATVVLGFSAAMKFGGGPPIMELLEHHLQYPASVVPMIAATELLCAILYAVPFTAPLGAVLLTGYMGGAIASHVRVSEPFTAPFVIATLAWVGLALRNPKILGLFVRDEG